MKPHLLTTGDPHCSFAVRHGNISFNLRTGYYKHIKISGGNKGNAARYVAGARAPEWNSLLDECFRLHIDPAKTREHLHSSIAAALVARESYKIKTIFSGSHDSGALDIYRILSKVALILRDKIFVSHPTIKPKVFNKTQLNVIPFPRIFEELESVPVIKFQIITENETSGILNECLSAYGRLIRRGHYLPSEEIKQATAHYYGRINPVPYFVSNALVKHEFRSGINTSLDEIYLRFLEFIGPDTTTLSKFLLKKRMVDCGLLCGLCNRKQVVFDCSVKMGR